MAEKAKKKVKKPLVVVITGSGWLRGDPANSALIAAVSGRMCCLGFDALACGLTKKQITGHVMPDSVPERANYQSAWSERVSEATAAAVLAIVGTGLQRELARSSGTFVGSRLGAIAAGINDDRRFIGNDKERIAALRHLFRAAGRKLVWRPDL